MLQYERINVSEETDLNKSNESKEFMIFHYLYFQDIGYKHMVNSIEPYVCNKYQNISMMVYVLDDFIILNIKSVYYKCVSWNMTKNEAINKFNSSKLNDKGIL